MIVHRMGNIKKFKESLKLHITGICNDWDGAYAPMAMFNMIGYGVCVTSAKEQHGITEEEAESLRDFASDLVYEIVNEYEDKIDDDPCWLTNTMVAVTDAALTDGDMNSAALYQFQIIGASPFKNGVPSFC